MSLDFVIREGEYSWTARTGIASWVGYRDCGGPYGMPATEVQATGQFDIVFAPEGRDDSPLKLEELATVEWLLSNEPRISEAVKAAIFAAYPGLRDEYGYSEEELAEFMPELTSSEGLKKLIGLTAIHIHQVAKDGIPYVGFELGCSWDPEHGVGLMMHDTRVVDLGGADSAILLWIAEQDRDGG